MKWFGGVENVTEEGEGRTKETGLKFNKLKPR
jgi:hypothetical protein